jgi:uncharacterized protein YegL
MQHDFLLLDRSGSMEGPMWTEALGSINAYVKKLADNNVDTGVTVAAFDSMYPFQIVRDRITPKTWKDITNSDVTPRGGTPLNDATGKLLDLAEKGTPWGGQYEKVAIIIMTDGYENSSQEYSVATGGTTKIKARLDAARAKNWQVIFLGANFDNAQQATSYGAAAASVQSSTASMRGTMSSLAEKRTSYGVTGQSIGFSDEEKAKAKK